MKIARAASRLTIWLQFVALISAGSFADKQFPEQFQPVNLEDQSNREVEYNLLESAPNSEIEAASSNMGRRNNHELSDVEKRHIGSVLAQRQTENNPNIIKRHVSSLIKCRTSLCKETKAKNNSNKPSPDPTRDQRVKGGFFNWDYFNRLFGNANNNFPPTKRFFSSNNLDSDYANGDLAAEKRHVGSLLQEKRHVGSLLQEKRHLSSVLPDQKRHLSSVFSDQKRHISSLFPQGRTYGRESGHIAGFFPSYNTYGSKFVEQLQNPYDFHSDTSANSIIDKPEITKYVDQFDKRHYGALLKSNDNIHLPSILKQKRNDGMPYLSIPYNQAHVQPVPHELSGPYKRHFSTTLRQTPVNRNKRDAPITKGADNSDAIQNVDGDTLISIQDHAHQERDAVADQSSVPAGDTTDPNVKPGKDLVRKKRYIGSLAKSNSFPFRSTSYIYSNSPERARSVNVIRQMPNSEIIEGYETPDIYPSEAVGYFPPPQKKFLGSLARQGWFPRQYRSFAEPTVPKRQNSSPRSSAIVWYSADAGPISKPDYGSSYYVPNGYLG